MIACDNSLKNCSSEVQIVVLLGQSNMEGHTFERYLEKTVGSEKAKSYKNGFENVKIAYQNSYEYMNSDGKFVPVKTGYGVEVDRFGAEVGIAEKLFSVEFIKPVYLIKYAYGGTSLALAWRSPSSGNTGELYTGAVKYILDRCKALENMGLRPAIKAICWMQGEDDSNTPFYVRYEELERNFVADLRKDLSCYKPFGSEICFVDAGISDCPAWTNYIVVNDAKKSLADADEHHFYIDTIAEGLRYNAEPPEAPDIYHFDSFSEIKLGNLFAQVLLEKCLEV